MKLALHQEGKIKFYASPALGKGAFYNPAAELQRDISVSVAQVWQKLSAQKLNICDALSAAGIRGLRYAGEVSGIKSVILNDKNPASVSVLRKNIKLNKFFKLCKASRSDANILLHSRVFDFIDLDPFGSPNLFLDAAARSIWHKGFLAVTATDTGPLGGSFPSACFRKYGLLTFKGSPFYAELGVRALVSHIILTFARRDRAFIPLLSHASHHYFRCYGKMEHSGMLENILKQFGFVSYNPKTGEFIISSAPEKGLQFAGPLYLGQIQDRRFIQEVANDLKARDFRQKSAEMKLLNMLAHEADSPPLYYDLHALARLYKKPVPCMETVFSKLRKAGYAAARTHFCGTAIKTDAPFRSVAATIRDSA